MLKCRTMTTVR